MRTESVLEKAEFGFKIRSVKTKIPRQSLGIIIHI